MNALLTLLTGSFLIAASSGAAAEPAKSSTVAQAPDKIICKRFLRTGSLVDGYRTCKTKHEWDREHENIQKLDVVDSCRARGSGGACGTG